MALRHALLSRLSHGLPRNGYELAALVGNVNEPLWNASPSQVYAELRKMEAAGLIVATTREERGGTSYGITDAGHDEIRHWLRAGEPDRALRDDVMQRIVMVWALDSTQARHLVEAEIAFHRKRIMYLRNLVDEWDFAKTEPIHRFRYASFWLWVSQSELSISWLERLIELLDQPDADVRSVFPEGFEAPHQGSVGRTHPELSGERRGRTPESRVILER